MDSPDKARENYQAEIDRAAEDPDSFHNSFDRNENVAHHYIRGAWDVSSQILNPLLGVMKDPETKTALEIGFGAGRLLAAISPYFEKVIGIDIHNQQDLVGQRLRERGITNFELRKTDGATIPAEAGSIDFIYSFIVLQHLGRRERLVQYLSEDQHVLRPGGIALIFVGRRSYYSYCSTSTLRYWLDRLIEMLPGVPAYREIEDSNPLEINLTITAPKMKRMTRKAGFEFISIFPSRRKSPNDFSQFGSQYGARLRKK